MKDLKDIPSLTTKRRSISRLTLAEALPVGVWFDNSKVEADISDVSLKGRLSTWPFVEMKRINHKKIMFRINKSDYKNLIAWAQKGRRTNSSANNQKTTAHMLSIADICQNIAEGMHVNNVLPEGI